MRRLLALAAAGLALCAAGCGDRAAPDAPRWTGSWTLDVERTARSVADFAVAERAEILRSMASPAMGGPEFGMGPPEGPQPSDEVMLRQARGWMRGMSAEVVLKEDGSARAELFFGGTKVAYIGTWSEVGDGAEMRIASRTEGILQGQDGLPLHLRRDAEFLVLGGETDAQGKLRPPSETNTVVPRRRMYLSRK